MLISTSIDEIVLSYSSISLEILLYVRLPLLAFALTLNLSELVIEVSNAERTTEMRIARMAAAISSLLRPDKPDSIEIRLCSFAQSLD